MRTRTTAHLVLAMLGMLWLAAVASSVHYRNITWLQYLFVDLTWLQVLLIVAGGYGTVLVLVGALTRSAAPPPLAGPPPMVSIVVPAKDEETVIEATVRSLCALEYGEDGQRRYEVIVVDDQSTDRTPAILERLATDLLVTVVRTPEGSRGKAAALNLGIARARSDLIAVFDADARVAPDFLQRTVRYTADPRVGGVQSQRLVYNAGQNLVTRGQDDEYRLFGRTLQQARQVLGAMVSFAGNGLLLRREALDEVGGWNEDALTEDIDLTVRFHLAGWQIRYCNDAVVWEEAVPHLGALIRQRVRWFDGAIRCLGDHLPGILFGRASVLKRIDMLFFLGGAPLVTLAVLTTYLYAVVDAAGAVVLYVQLPARVATAASALISVALAAAGVVEYRGRVVEAVTVLARSAAFSVYRVLVLPLAIWRYVHSAITGETSWEKTAHGASDPARAWMVRTHSEDKL